MKLCLDAIAHSTIVIFIISVLMISFKIKISEISTNEILDLDTIQTLKTIKQMDPILQKMQKLKYFRFFRVDITKKCEFWVTDALCTDKQRCQLCECPAEKLPKSWLDEDMKMKEAKAFNKFRILEHVFDKKPKFNLEQEEEKIELDVWKLDQINENYIYVDLHDDREEYTGYQGQQIWEIIYKENCKKFYDMCGENQILYKLISGMHTSVSSHLSFYYRHFPKNKSKFSTKKPKKSFKYYPNLWLYLNKVGLHQERIDNLIFAISVLVKGISRYADEIKNFGIELDDFNEEIKTKNNLKLLLSVVAEKKETSFSNYLFFTKFLLKKQEKDQFTNYYKNIVKIMDCVECQKCQVYGKMQVLGLTVALRKLLNDEPIQLTRNELVALVNTLSKWVESVRILRIFQDDLYKKKRDILLCLAGMLILTLLMVRKFKSLYQNYQKDKKSTSKILQKEKENKKAKEKEKEKEKTTNGNQSSKKQD